MRSARLFLRLLRWEGPAAVRDRLLGRLADRRRRRGFERVPWPSAHPRPDELPAEVRPALLHLLGTPPAPRLGGVQLQLLQRLEAVSSTAPSALLHPLGASLRLELLAGARRLAAERPRRGHSATTPPHGAPAVDTVGHSAGIRSSGGAAGRDEATLEAAAPALHDADWHQAVRQAADWLGVRSLRAEGLHGLPMGSLGDLAEEGFHLHLALHDFTAFCPRPHLLEQPLGAFCEFCRDLARCSRCLDAPPRAAPAGAPPAQRAERQRRWRAEGGRLLRLASTITYPSAYLMRCHLQLFGLPDDERHRVVPPRAPALPPPPPRPRQRLRVAVVGGATPVKGSRAIAAALDDLRPDERDRLQVTLFGGGDAEELRELRRRGVRIRGYYLPGTLPRLLARRRIDVAVLASVVPESYGMVVEECWQAGVPVIAFDHGAVAARCRALGAGDLLVDVAAGGVGIAGALRALLAPA